MENSLQKLKIVLCIGTLGVGGAEKQLCRLAVELAALGHEVNVVVLDKRGPLTIYLEENNIPFHGLFPEIINSRWKSVCKVHRWVYFLKNIFPLLRKLNPDVIHAWLFHAYATILPVSLLLNIPVRISGRRGLHSSLKKSWITNIGSKVSNFCTTSFTANAEEVLKDILVRENVERAKVKCITNGVDIPLASANCRASIPTGVVVANLIHYKGHIDLLRCLPLVNGNFRIIFVGEGPMRGQIEKEIQVLGLSKKVTLLGFCEDPISLLLESQFSILPSHTEGLPNAILESMACGLPVISTDVGGVKELISECGGLVIEVHDGVSFAKGIQYLLDNEDFRVSAGEYNRHISESFSWNEVSNNYSRYYESEYRRVTSRKKLVR